MKHTKQQKMHQLVDERVKAFEHLTNVAIFALNNGCSQALNMIMSAFLDYETAAKKSEQYIRRNFREEYTPIYVLFSHKTITDVYRTLSLQVKDLWDAVPELKGWRDKFR